MNFTLKLKSFFILTSLFFFINAESQVTVFPYTGGLQTYTVPPGVTSIQIETIGAEGGKGGDGLPFAGDGGAGVRMQGDFVVTPGQVLTVLVGEKGIDATHVGGGGGGSFVWDDGTSTLLIASGAGGGGGKRTGGDLSNIDGMDAVITNNATDGNGFSDGGGVGGNGGTSPTAINWSAGGAGWNSNGANGTLHGCTFNSIGGQRPLLGGAGGTGGGGAGFSATGGYGGGGGGNARCGAIGGGGGGGYSGGGSGGEIVWNNFAGGGGGGSYNDGTSQVNLAGVGIGNGGVTITVLCTELTVTVSATEVCDGDEVTLDATSDSGASITWDGGGIDGVPFTPPLGTTTYTATSADTDDCEYTVDILVNPTPTVTITTDVTELCDGETVTFTESGDADTYVWDPVDVISGTPYSPAGIGTTTYTLTGEFTVTGCQTITTVDVTVNPLPTVTASVDEIEICLGEDIVFTGGGADTYVWDMGVIDGIAFTPGGLGIVTYTVTGTITATSCQNTATIDVTVNDTPTITASADETEICEGETVTLTGGGASTYTWDLGVTDGTAFSPPLGTTTYTVIGETGAGCEGTNTIDITVNELPTVVATADDTEVCDGESVTLSGTGATTYTWDLGGTDGVSFSPPLGTTTYTVTGTDSGTDCENTATIDIIVNELPTVGATADDTDICEGEAVIFTGTGADSYTWDLGVTDGSSFTPGSAGTTTYTVIGTNAGTDCENTATIDITVHETPIVIANSTSTEVCLGESFTLTGSGADSYTWDLGITDGASNTPSTEGSTIYTVTGTTSFDCSATATITIVVIDCEPVVPAFSLQSPVCVGDCITINDQSTGAVASWDWEFNGAVDPTTSTEQNPIICLTTAGTYPIELTVTSATGAVSTTSNTIVVNDNPLLSAGRDTIVDLGGKALLLTNTVSTGTYIWSPEKDVDCPICPETWAEGIETTTYTVSLIDNNGCTAEDTVRVMVNFVEGVGVPTAFSPNGDEINDILFVRGFALEAVHFIIYNRYGEIVFETSDQNIGWDGTFKNKKENPGVFTWVLNYQYLNGNKGKQKGNTTLIR